MRLVIILTVVLSLIGATTVEEKQDQLNAINRELARQKQLLRQTREKEKASLRNLYVLNRNVARAKNELRYNQHRLTLHDQALNQTQSELQKTIEEYQARQKVFSRRLREMYKTQNMGYLGMFFANRSFSEMVDNSYYYKRIIDADIENINHLTSVKQEISSKELSLKQRKRQIEETHREIAQQKARLETKARQQQTVYVNIRAQRQDYERRVNELLRNSTEIEGMIKKMLAEAPSISRGTGTFIWPVRGVITSYFGNRRHPIFRVVKFHTGIDVAARSGTPIKAADSGVVIFSGWWGGYGNVVIINHGKGLQTVYAHQLRRYVSKGDKVDKHQVIGLVGSTGYSTGPHLHFEVRRNGETQNPMRYLP